MSQPPSLQILLNKQGKSSTNACVCNLKDHMFSFWRAFQKLLSHSADLLTLNIPLESIKIQLFQLLKFQHNNENFHGQINKNQLTSTKRVSNEPMFEIFFAIWPFPFWFGRMSSWICMILNNYYERKVKEQKVFPARLYPGWVPYRIKHKWKWIVP